MSICHGHPKYLNKNDLHSYIIKKIKMSNKKINPEIAEILGAFIGDGWIESRERGFYIMGSPTEDKDYYDNFLAPLFSKHFTEIDARAFPCWSVYGIASYKKYAINRAIDLGFQVGPKSLVAEIPDKLMFANKKTKKAILRGIFDTDGSFWCDKSRATTSVEWKRTYNYIPQMRITSCSKKLINQIKLLLNEFDIRSEIKLKSKKGFKCNRNINNSFALNIRKKLDIEKWFDLIGTNNPRHQTRYDVWKKLGYLPPRTTIEERKKILLN